MRLLILKTGQKLLLLLSGEEYGNSDKKHVGRGSGNRASLKTHLHIFFGHVPDYTRSFPLG